MWAVPNLSVRQTRILEMIRQFSAEFGYPPSIREIGAAVGISSTSVVSYNLQVLERKGFLSRESFISRGLRLAASEEAGSEERQAYPVAAPLSVPLYGVIAAGEPIPVPDNDLVEADLERVAIPAEALGTAEGLYALRVRGNSMIDALVSDGDIVIMRHQQTAENGDMIAAWLREEKETTLKRYYLDRERGLVRLQPANPAMQPIYVQPRNLEIQGKAVLVIRQLD